MPFFAKSLTPGDAISRLGANDPTLVTCDLSKNAVLSMKVHELLPQFAKALESNTACTDLNLSACNIDDAGVAALAKGLSANSGLQTLNLEGNTIKDGGAQELAKALATNKHLSTLNLLNQKGSRFGDSTLGEFLTMFETNVTLLKIVWRLESRQSFRLTKMLTRNNDIARRIKEGREYTDLLPSAVSGIDEEMIRMRASVASAVGMPGGDRASQASSRLSTASNVSAATPGSMMSPRGGPETRMADGAAPPGPFASLRSSNISSRAGSIAEEPPPRSPQLTAALDALEKERKAALAAVNRDFDAKREALIAGGDAPAAAPAASPAPLGARMAKANSSSGDEIVAASAPASE